MKINDIIQELKRFDFKMETNIIGIKKTDKGLVFDIETKLKEKENVRRDKD